MTFIINPEPREIMNTYIPITVRSEFSRVITDAYKWSDILINNTQIFNSLRGRKRLLPEIKNVAVEFFIVQAVKNKKLPFRYRIGFNSNFSHPYLELYNDDVLIHFNQVASKNKCARKAFCRNRHIRPIQSYMTFDQENIAYDDQKYFQINHGYQSPVPSFISLGIPNEQGVFGDAIQLLEEYVVVEGFYPKSTIQAVDEFSFEEFQRYAEGEDNHESQQTS